MKRLSVLAIFCMLLSCTNIPENKEKQLAQSEIGFPEIHSSVGEDFSEDEILSEKEMYEQYGQLEEGDTLNVKFKTKVNSVCKKKGCWMKVDLQKGDEAMVRFKNYGFFVPKDIEESEVVMSGKAYITEMTVEDQRHFAEDGGQSPEEVAAIVDPKRTLSFLADGVVLENESL